MHEQKYIIDNSKFWIQSIELYLNSVHACSIAENDEELLHVTLLALDLHSNFLSLLFSDEYNILEQGISSSSRDPVAL